MTPTIPCPGCRTPLNLSDDICPVCMRARSKQEIVRGYAQVRQEEERRKRRPFVIIAWLLVSGAVVCLLYFLQPLIALGLAQAQSRLARFYNRITDPNYARSAEGNAVPSAEPPTPALPPLPHAPPPIPVAVERAIPAPRTPVAPAPEIRLPQAPLPPLRPGQWLLQGRVYDLLTLAPAPNVALAAKVGESPSSSFYSDRAGRYRVVLNRQSSGPGYEIVASDSRYAAAVQYEGDIPYARLSADERRQLARSARDGDSHSTPLADIAGESTLRRDLFVCPRR